MSHRAAAELLSILRGGSTFFEVTTPRNCRDRPHVRFHRARLPGDEVTLVRGIPVTTVPRTIFDLAGGGDRLRVERAMNEAEVRRLTDRLSVPDLMARYPRHRGNATLSEILAAGRLGEGITRSRLEDRFVAFLDLAEIERPSLNVPVQAGGESFEVDCLWRAQRLIVELDGHATHANRAGFEADRLRDRRLQAAGWRVVRITWHELHRHPKRLAVDLRTMLAGPVLHSA